MATIITFHDKICRSPKTELHVHIEGALTPELMFHLAKRNNVKLPYNSADELRTAYSFTNLQSFLDICAVGVSVLITCQDFYDVTMDYIQHAVSDNIVHSEVFFDPQLHTHRAEEKYNFSSKLIMCFLRHLDEQDALDTFIRALPLFDQYKHRLIGIGLDPTEQNHPPEEFQRLFVRAREHHLRVVAHAGEEGPPLYIKQALDILKVERIDHGVRSVEDELLVKLFDDMKKHSLKQLLDSSVMVTINSDDPTYFGGYLNANYLAVTDAFHLDQKNIYKIIRNDIIQTSMGGFVVYPFLWQEHPWANSSKSPLTCYICDSNIDGAECLHLKLKGGVSSFKQECKSSEYFCSKVEQTIDNVLSVTRSCRLTDNKSSIGCSSATRNKAASI
ncbi:unnamed protein product [Didymodactylos carnosus]|uniref:Adenosine deaminase domain-containing protein n=1 Tax=Didymodactylos carnosus TaxID=1234261 RepID=A0A814LR14_9BILA|nr:unnamed protein product [Didymodactylos carnosus]CAF3835493.1 unnamed protein product [Didymodactylos carnosus]